MSHNLIPRHIISYQITSRHIKSNHINSQIDTTKVAITHTAFAILHCPHHYHHHHVFAGAVSWTTSYGPVEKRLKLTPRILISRGSKQFYAQVEAVSLLFKKLWRHCTFIIFLYSSPLFVAHCDKFIFLSSRHIRIDFNLLLTVWFFLFFRVDLFILVLSHSWTHWSFFSAGLNINLRLLHPRVGKILHIIVYMCQSILFFSGIFFS